MFSLASIIAGHLFKPLCCTTPPSARLFTTCLVNFSPCKDHEERKLASRRAYEHLQTRMANDPEYAQKTKQRWTESRERRRIRLANDPEFAQNARQKQNEYKARKYRQNSDYREARINYSAARHKANLADHTEYTKALAYRAAMERQYSNDPTYVRRKKLSYWLRDNAWVRHHVSWKTHEPIMYPEKVEHRCTECHLSRRLKLWWRQKLDPTNYDCYRCFAKDWPRAIPIGYEHHDFAKGYPKRP